MSLRKDEHRSQLLDYYRWGLASYVFLFHAWAFQRAWDSETSYDFLKNILQFGYLSVDVFFILSGYVIIKSSMNHKPRVFFVKRLLRLVPPYIFVTIIETLMITVFSPLINNSKMMFSFNVLFDTFKNMIPISSKDNEIRNFVGWSIAVEIKFYFIILCVIMVSQLIKKDNRFLLNISMFWIASLYLTKYFNIDMLKQLVIYDYAPMFIIGLLLGTTKMISMKIIVIQVVFVTPFVAEHFMGRLAGIGDEFYGFSITILLLIISVILIKIPLRGNKFASMIGQSSYSFYLICGNFGMALLDTLDTSFLQDLGKTYVICTFLAIIINQLTIKVSKLLQ
jgi:peptidoglycan/LPS O-acetylase OafA/YrhL